MRIISISEAASSWAAVPPSVTSGIEWRWAAADPAAEGSRDPLRSPGGAQRSTIKVHGVGSKTVQRIKAELRTTELEGDPMRTDPDVR